MISRQLTISVLIMSALALGMSAYVWRVRGHVNRTVPAAANSQPLAPPVAGPTDQVTLYVAYDDDGSLRAQTARTPLPPGRQERATELLRALLGIYLDRFSPHPLSPGSEVRNVYLVDPSLAVIDVSTAFANGHRSGILIEDLTIASFVHTLSANIPGITRVKILVDGKDRDTLAGHADLTGFFDVTAVEQMISSLQPER